MKILRTKTMGSASQLQLLLDSLPSPAYQSLNNNPLSMTNGATVKEGLFQGWSTCGSPDVAPLSVLACFALLGLLGEATQQHLAGQVFPTLVLHRQD